MNRRDHRRSVSYSKLLHKIVIEQMIHAKDHMGMVQCVPLAIRKLPKRLGAFQEIDEFETPLPMTGTRNASRGVLRNRNQVVACPLSSDGSMLDEITISSVTVSRLFESMQKKLLHNLEQKHNQQVAALEQVVKGLSAEVSSELRDMQGVIQMLCSNSMKGMSSNRTASRTSLAEREKKLDDMTPNVKIIFSTELLARIIAYNAPLKMLESFCKGEECPSRNAAQAVQTLLFSLQPSEKKELYAEGTGSDHSRYKYTVIQNLFFNVCKNSFGLFRRSALRVPGPISPCSREDISNVSKRSGSMNEGDFNGVIADDKGEIMRPAWLRPGFVTVDHIQSARKFLETSNQSRKNKVRDTPTPNDIATHGALRVYRQVGAHFHQARENVRASFFQGIWYKFVPWSVHITDICQSSLKMEFADPGEELLLDLDIRSIPETNVCSFNADAKNTNIADAANKQLLCSLFSEWQSMVVSVRHDVHVVNKSGAQRRHSGGTRRTLYRLIHLIDVACDICVEYCRVGTREIFLRTNSSALQCIMVFAVLFKAVLVEHIGMSSNGGRDGVMLDPKLVQDGEFNLKDLIPGKNTQRSRLQSRCLQMTQQEFETYKHTPEELVDESGNIETAEDLEGVTIQESAARGIASL